MLRVIGDFFGKLEGILIDFVSFLIDLYLVVVGPKLGSSPLFRRAVCVGFGSLGHKLVICFHSC